MESQQRCGSAHKHGKHLPLTDFEITSKDLGGSLSSEEERLRAAHI